MATKIHFVLRSFEGMANSYNHVAVPKENWTCFSRPISKDSCTINTLKIEEMRKFEKFQE